MNKSSIKNQICSKSIMDNIGDPDISFDSQGVCNYYYDFKNKLKLRVPNKKEGEIQLNKIIDKIKSKGKGKNYDCIIGVSGGVDSTYTAYIVKKLGLRPLAVHLDNGWNSELAVKNIEHVLNKLKIDLYTEVLDWAMFKDLQLSFLKSATPDGEIPTDHAIFSILYKLAYRFNVKYVISGMNFRTEGMLPPTWANGHFDWKYIKSVHKKFGTKSIDSYPGLPLCKLFYYSIFKRIQLISIINYVDFKKDEAMRIIRDNLGWRDYGGKHHESIYTRFFQSYILPNKFGIDKRKAHLSCLIMSTGEITRKEALDIVSIPALTKSQELDDKEYVIKKLGISDLDLDLIMNQANKSIDDYPNNSYYEMKLRQLVNYLRKLKILPN